MSASIIHDVKKTVEEVRASVARLQNRAKSVNHKSTLVQENARLKALLDETRTDLKRKLEELKTEYDTRVLDETQQLRTELRAATTGNTGLESENKKLTEEITRQIGIVGPLQEQISDFKTELAKFKAERLASSARYNTLFTSNSQQKVSLRNKTEELGECLKRNEYLLKKQKEGKTKLRRLKVHQEVFKGGRSTSPSDLIYRGRKFIRGKLMKKQAEIEQKARENARELFAEQVPDDFADNKYYSTSPAVRRVMRKIQDETSDEKQAKQVRDAYRNERKARHAKRFELTLTRK